MVFSKTFFTSTLCLAFIYLVLITYTRNSVLINSTVFIPNTFFFKVRLYTALFEGMITMSGVGIINLLSIALLTGANITLIAQKFIRLRKVKNIHFVAGSGSVLGIISGGCASCGVPLLSLLGVSGSVVLLPFKGAELPYIAMMLLLLSFYYLIKRDSDATRACTTNEKRYVGKK